MVGEAHYLRGRFQGCFGRVGMGEAACRVSVEGESGVFHCMISCHALGTNILLHVSCSSTNNDSAVRFLD